MARFVIAPAAASRATPRYTLRLCRTVQPNTHRMVSSASVPKIPSTAALPSGPAG